MQTWQTGDRIISTIHSESDISQIVQSHHALQQMIHVVQLIAMKLEVFQFVISPMQMYET